ncbi:MAG TPA: leucyl/phenylalanyl-tRNA--protein transferase [Pyrinomonadaceae bacterium]|jgi:leucyl/phenylalanyl-tRNA--protein transferase|nr:leucyl/phenylalanyl-tRNA--protein transferase [Pyrinomonadaceae bacterium]
MKSRDRELIHFLDPADAIDGIVALGGPLTTTNLMRAYCRGIFPWPINDYILPWCCPDERGILEFNDLHIPRRLARIRQKSIFHFSIDRAFPQVITYCATVQRKHQASTWITGPMIRAYCELHRLGHAHSVEVWECTELAGRHSDLVGARSELVGGLYGVDACGTFAGESMFSLRSNASKLALLFLIDYLKAHNLDWIDVQMLTPHLEALGAKAISRADFLDKLTTTQKRKLTLFPPIA